MTRACKTCESTDFEIENCERVCTTCGEVQEDMPGDEGNLQMLSDHQTIIDNIGSKDFDTGDRLNNRVRGEGQSADTKRSIGKAKLLDGMKRIVKQLIKEPSAVDETMDLMKSTFQAYQKRMLTPKKNGLAGACVYYLSAKHQLGISLNDICKALDIKMKVISVCLKEVKKLCPDFEYERPNIKHLVRKFVDQMASRNFELTVDSIDAPGCSSNSNIKTETQPLIDKKDKVVLQNRVMLLLDLFEAMHPYKQPSPQSLITAVIYHAWKSLDTFKAIALNLKRTIHDLERSQSPGGALVVADPELEAEEVKTAKDTAAKHSISYKKFCELSNLKYSSNGHNIVSKLQSSLLALGRHIGDVNKINLPWYLEDIIDNSQHLLQEHKRNEPTVQNDDDGIVNKPS